MRLSPSKVDCFLGCKRLYKYRYITNPIPVTENKYFIIGNTVHKALELFHQKLPETKKKDYKKLMVSCFRVAAGTYRILQKERAGWLSQDDLFNMKRMLQGYLRWTNALDKLPKVVSVEKMFKFDLEYTTVSGKADRVDKVSDGYKVVDYKTGTPLTKKDSKESVQLPTYGLWIKKTKDLNAKVYGEYVYVKHMGTKKESYMMEITGEVIAEALEKYTRVSFLLKNGCKFTRNRDYKFCRICDYSGYCAKDKED